ncbi:hypothetical protein [Riemerella anatipestifer]|uniref:hypothetical protein n=1 Tax=Riemerella anatipestifer TaxID=34085 RepID=UPI0012DB6AB7|nr:hypothetical protein [Riemerella anatipestifer]MCW0507971.1 hypothetical protein [Riemerella anatipestifer]MCW0518263.1 hypothetical protein [Riemerella anatipestifer]
MKKALLFFALSLIIFTSCSNKTQYKKGISDAYVELGGAFFWADMITGEVASVWHRAIFDRSYQGQYVSDFNEALAQFRNEDVMKTSIDSMDSCYNKGVSNVEKIKNPPKEYEGVYNDIVILATKTGELVKLAKEPEGSLTSFSEKRSRLKEEINAKMHEIALKNPELLEKGNLSNINAH